MSIQALAWVLENSQSELGDRLVLLALANHADAAWCCFPSVPQIAVEAGVSERSVYRSIASLELLGELEKAAGGGRGRRNSYRIAAYKRCHDVTVNPNLTLTGCHETLTSCQSNPDTPSYGTVINRHEPSRAPERAREAQDVWQTEHLLTPLTEEQRKAKAAALRAAREQN